MAASITQNNIMKRLVELDCPFLAEDEETWMINLLEPSEARLRLLTWLVTKFDQKFGEIIVKQAPSADNRVDSRIQRMLFVCSMMGICNADDVELIKGKASKKKQIIFWDNLTSLVCSSETQHRPKNIESSIDGYQRKQRNDDRYESFCRTIDNIVREENTNDLFSPSITLFPLDLERLFVSNADDSKSSSSTPDNNVLLDIAEKLSTDVLKSRNEHGTSKQQRKELSQSDIDQHCKKLTLGITMLKQLITNFLHCHEIDLKQWCNRPKAKKSGVGPTCQRTLQMAINHDELLKEMEILKNARETIKDHISKAVTNVQSKPELGYEAIADLREVVDILRESERRIKEIGG